jgi:hypothetical protein
MSLNDLVYGCSSDGFIILGCNNYNYINDDIIMKLLRNNKKVLFTDNFNAPIDFLPDGIEEIHLGRFFNKPIDNLPSTLKKLIICANELNYCKFNQPLDNLPTGLEYLVLKLIENFNHTLNNLPFNLKELHLVVKSFNQSLNNLPEGLEKLIVSKFNFYETYSLPSTLKEVNITYKIIPEETEIIQKNLISKYPNIKFILNE